LSLELCAKTILAAIPQRYTIYAAALSQHDRVAVTNKFVDELRSAWRAEL
jgi:hypothetical protein